MYHFILKNEYMIEILIYKANFFDVNGARQMLILLNLHICL